MAEDVTENSGGFPDDGSENDATVNAWLETPAVTKHAKTKARYAELTFIMILTWKPRDPSIT